MFWGNKEFQEKYEKFLEIQDSYNNNSEILSELKLECKRYSKLAEKYLPKCNEIYLIKCKEVVRKEYSVGGELLPRGYYCPSPIIDIVVGNCNRGKLLKRVTSRSRLAYEYCFDSNDRLILVNVLQDNLSEIIMYDNNTVTGITFSKIDKPEIISITECEYDRDNKIISYCFAHSSFNDAKIDNLVKERYKYNDTGLCEAEVFDYFSNSLNYHKYSFKHNENGYLSEYTAEPSFFEDNTYKVYVKRKI